MNSGEMLSRAIALAAQKFEGKLDRGGQPYILHCLKVMHYVKSDDHSLLCIAVLHDILEDTDIVYTDLELMFSTRVAEGVLAVTRLDDQSEEEYLDAIKDNHDAIRVKLADLRHNSDIRRLKGLREKDFERLEKYHRMYMSLKAALALAGGEGE